MLIVCPACASAYEIEAERVGATGRAVRCAACRETWFITPDEVAAAAMAEMPFEDADGFEAIADEADAAGPVLDQPAPYVAPAAARPRAPASRLPKLSPAIAAGLVLFVLAPLALLGRSTVVRAMPQTAGAFARIGLPVNLRGIDLRDVVAFQSPAEGGKPPLLVVEGDLVGVARERVDVPDIAVAVRDAQGQTLYRWTTPAPRVALETGENARFRASLSAPPAQGRTIEVRFADAKPAETAPEAAHAPEAPAAAHEAPAKEAAHEAPPAPAHGH